MSSDLSLAETESLLQLLTKHKSIFDSNCTALGKTWVAAHRIETEGSRISYRHYTVCLHQKGKLSVIMSPKCLSGTILGLELVRGLLR